MEMKTATEKVKDDIRIFRKIMDNKKFVMRLGMMLFIAGFLVVWASGFVIDTSPMVAKIILDTGTLFTYIGVIFIVYYIMRFSIFAKKPEGQITENITEEELTKEIEKSIE